MDAPPYRLNTALAALALALAAVELVAVPFMLLPGHPGLALLAVCLTAAATPFKGALIHEAIHGRLLAAPRRSDALGRALALTSGVAFDVLRFGHLAHHRFNRHALDRPDVIPQGRGPVLAQAAYYAHLLGGVWLAEAAATLLMLAPRPLLERLARKALPGDDRESRTLLAGAERAIRNPVRLRRVRLDALLALAVYGAAFALYGDGWWILAVAMAIRALIVSLQDNAPHYGTPAIIGADAYDTRLPDWLAPALLHQNLHDVHHKRPDLAWSALPRAFAGSGRTYAGGYLAAVLRQLKGPVRNT
ncbi:MAG TPA: fatty acid desaturase [Beijerinckiaceae bacterium]|jgi:fatty acid desaturase